MVASSAPEAEEHATLSAFRSSLTSFSLRAFLFEGVDLGTEAEARSSLATSVATTLPRILLAAFGGGGAARRG